MTNKERKDLERKIDNSIKGITESEALYRDRLLDLAEEWHEAEVSRAVNAVLYRVESRLINHTETLSANSDRQLRILRTKQEIARLRAEYKPKETV